MELSVCKCIFKVGTFGSKGRRPNPSTREGTAKDGGFPGQIQIQNKKISLLFIRSSICKEHPKTSPGAAISLT